MKPMTFSEWRCHRIALGSGTSRKEYRDYCFVISFLAKGRERRGTI